MAASKTGYSEPASPNKYLATQTFTQDGSTAHAQEIVICDASGNVVGVTSNALDVNTEMAAAAALADAAANPTTPMVGAPMMALNLGNNAWDRWRNNSLIIVLTSAARTTTQTSADLSNTNWRGIHLCVNVTSAGTGSITPKVEGRDAAAAVSYELLAATAPITANGIYVYEVYPGVGAGSGGITQAVSRALPRTFRTVITANNANSVTYSVTVNGIV